MQESKESSKNSFIESLIKYKKHFGQTFPILSLKNNSQEDIILKIEMEKNRKSISIIHNFYKVIHKLYTNLNKPS